MGNCHSIKLDLRYLVLLNKNISNGIEYEIEFIESASDEAIVIMNASLTDLDSRLALHTFH